MLRLVFVVTLVVVMTASVAVRGALADDWQWPSQMTVAGFNISGIRGSVNPDGSGAAAGSLQIPGISGQPINLTRSARGDISGAMPSFNARAAGASIQGDLRLTGRGLEGRGSIQGATKPIGDASIAVAPNGRFTGSGRLALGNLGVPVKFEVSGSTLGFNGSSPVQSQVDTPLAVYRFDGALKVDGGAGGKLGVVARGQVQRTGKLANQVTNQAVSDVPVNPSDGRATINVGGVAVTFKFF